MEIKFVVQKVSDPPQLSYLRTPFLDLSENESITFALIEKGMASGEPSIMIISENPEGSVILQTSLDKLITATDLAISNAKHKFGWERPEGYASLMPMDSSSRKAILEQIKKELEEWETISTEISNEDTNDE